jgi:Xaa-Pro aminopeptidase
LDFGCKKDGYCSDMTRTVALGEVTDEMRRVYEIVRQAKAAGIAAAYPGREGREVHAAAAKVIEDAGYGEFFGHGFGHGLGLEVHENPSAAPSSETPLPENAVISAEPGIYLPGRFGVRIEDTIALRPGGAENLMAVGDELVTVNNEQLTTNS